MDWKELAHLFNRAWAFSLHRKKFLFLLPVLFFCGLLVVLCRALAFHAGAWVQLSLAFLPLFLSLGLLMASGVVLVRLYHHQIKGLPFSLRKTVRGLSDVLQSVSYLSIPLVFAYLVLWMLLGMFYLLKAIPKVGAVIGVVLSFGPFLLMLTALLLSVFAFLLLFFITPPLALRKQLRLKGVEEIFARVRRDLFSHLLLFFIGIAPLLLAVFLLGSAALMTGTRYVEADHTWSVALEWFFLMIPFGALLSPALLFFFNFSAEAHVWMQKR